MIFLIIGVLCRIDIQLSRNWVSTVALLCRCLLDKLRQNSTHTIFKNAMQTWQTHYSWSYNVLYENALHLLRSVDIKWYIVLRHTMGIFQMMHYITNFWLNPILERIVRFWVYTALGRTVRFLIEYCTRTYSMIFDSILYSDV